MPSYWWECRNCNNDASFKEITGDKGIAHFIWDKLVASDWNQDLLIRDCPKCEKKTLKITYEFPRQEKEVIQIIHIVGLQSEKSKYLPMMWETSPASEPENRWFDFKYLNGRNIWGLNKPAVFSKKGLEKVFELYSEKTKNKFIFE